MATDLCTGYKLKSVQCNDYTGASSGGFAVMNVESNRFCEQVPLAAASPLLGESPAMQEVFRLIQRVGPTEASVLLTGESGSGKELAAKAIHDGSPRCNGPFI